MRTARGFTLIEALVSAAIMSVILTGVGAVVIGTQAAIQSQFESRSATEGSSVAMNYIGRTLRFASYGIDPRFAFDFVPPTGGNKNNDSTHSASNDGLVVAGAYVMGYDTDDLAFRYRDPSYLRSGTFSGAAVALAFGQTVGVDLAKDQLMMIQCRTDASVFVFGRTTAAVAPAAGGMTLGNAGAPFPPIPGSLPGCLGTATTVDTAPAVMIVHEVRLRVVPIGGNPHLVAFHNFNSIDPTSANAVFDPIVGNVESFQVAYLMNTLPDGQVCCDTPAEIKCCASSPATCCVTKANWVNNDGILGDGVGWDQVAGVPTTTAVAAASDIPRDVLAYQVPTFDKESFSPQRFNPHPANIRGVRVTLTLRSPRPNPSGRTAPHALATVTDTFSTTATVENFTFALPLNDAAHKAFYQFFRVRTEQSFRLPNMSTRFAFSPPLTTGS